MKVYVAISKELNYEGCYYEGDVPSINVEYQIFKTKQEAEKFIESKGRCIFDWEVEEKEIE